MVSAFWVGGQLGPDCLGHEKYVFVKNRETLRTVGKKVP